MADEQFPFLRLPVEVRLMIYGLLLVLSEEAPPISPPSHAICFPCYNPQPTTPRQTKGPTLHIRIVDLFFAASALRPAPHTSAKFNRSTFAGRNPYRPPTHKLTYTLAHNPGIDAAILQTSRAVHAEAALLLYGSATFDFDADIEAVAPFFSDLTHVARAAVRAVTVAWRPASDECEYDRCDWADAMGFIACKLPGLQRLHLRVAAGLSPFGRDDVPEWGKDDLKMWVRRNWDALEWVRQLGRIKVAELQVSPIVGYGSLPDSEIMAFWIGLSKSIEGGFTEWLQELMAMQDG